MTKSLLIVAAFMVILQNETVAAGLRSGTSGMSEAGPGNGELMGARELVSRS